MHASMTAELVYELRDALCWTEARGDLHYLHASDRLRVAWDIDHVPDEFGLLGIADGIEFGVWVNPIIAYDRLLEFAGTGDPWTALILAERETVESLGSAQL